MKRDLRWRLTLAVAVALAPACGLNPQPMPPGGAYVSGATPGGAPGESGAIADAGQANLGPNPGADAALGVFDASAPSTTVATGDAGTRADAADGAADVLEEPGNADVSEASNDAPNLLEDGE
jgi:hypothetical protein